MGITVKRIYAPAARSDGFRVLVDRLWPRGVAKADARIDLWLQDVAPSALLRKWFDHDAGRWKAFCARYRAELRSKPELIRLLRAQANRGRVTLLYSARDERFNQAAALRAILTRSSTTKRSCLRRDRSAG